MSLGVSPTPTPQLAARSKPTAPHRKRQSYTPSPRLDRSGPPLSPAAHDRENMSIQRLTPHDEQELKVIGRDSLEEAIKEGWRAQDRLHERLEATETSQRQLESERDELLKAMITLQSRVEEAFNEQHRLEADLEGRDELLDRLRSRVSETERMHRDGQKRYAEQEKSFEAEREAFRSQEILLQSRIKTLQNRKITPPTTSSTSRSPSPERDNNEEIQTLQATQHTLLAQLNTLSKELSDLKVRNNQLEEENSGWEFLMKERTMSGKILDGGLFGFQDEDDAFDEGMIEGDMEVEDSAGRRRRGRTPLDDLEESLAMGLSETGNTPEKKKKKPSSRGGRRVRRSGDLDSEVLKGDDGDGEVKTSGSGMDLAAELELADDIPGEGFTVEVKNDESKALHAEVKQLKEANKALTLYCSKIIDRIIAQEGFEHILSVDYKTRRRNVSGTSTKSRSALQDAFTPSSSAPSLAPPPATLSSTSAGSVESGEPKVKKARPLSMMVRAISLGGSGSTDPVPTITRSPVKEDAPASVPVVAKPAPVAAPAPALARIEEESKAEKRARRGFSLDFRSFGFGSNTSPVEEVKPKLRPLQLGNRHPSTSSNKASSTSPSLNTSPQLGIPTTTIPLALPTDFSPPTTTPVGSIARKLDIEEVEDEDDLRERHRMEATMKLMGIERGPSPLSTPVIRETGVMEEPTVDSYDWNINPNIPSSSIVNPNGTPRLGSSPSLDTVPEKRNTPLARFSAMFSSSPVIPPSPPLGGVDQPMEKEEKKDEQTVAKEALKAFDEREARLSKTLSTGKSSREYTTSPPRAALGRRLSRRDSLIKEEVGAGGGGGGKGHGKGDSISTLWSMGSGEGEGDGDADADAQGEGRSSRPVSGIIDGDQSNVKEA